MFDNPLKQNQNNIMAVKAGHQTMLIKPDYKNKYLVTGDSSQYSIQ